MNNTTPDQKRSMKINVIRHAAGNPLECCPICTRSALAPYRRIVDGVVVGGCVDAFHRQVGLVSTASAAWHNRKEAQQLRANALKALQAV